MLDNYRNYRIQPNWDIALRERDKYVWLHEYSNAGTIYNKLYYDGNDLSTENSDYNFSLSSPTTLKLSSKSHGISKVFQSADHVIHASYAKERQRKAHLSSMDIGPSGELALSSSSDKAVCLWETATGDVRRLLEGHVAEVYSCRFFPSGLAALTAGADMQLKIWCLLTGACAATLPPGSAGALTGSGPSDELEPGGHRTGILDTGIIDRGRNIVAIDRFGWLRLWDVSSQLCISAMPLSPNTVRCPRAACPIVEEACCLAVKRQEHEALTMQQDMEDQSTWYQALETCSPKATEVGTAYTVVAVGMGSGAAVQLYDLRQRSKGCLARFTLPHTTGSVESCAFPQTVSPAADASPKVPHHRESSSFTDYGLIAGGQNGELASWDMRNSKEPLMTLTDEKNAIHQLQVLSTSDGRHLVLVVGRSDGRVMVYRYDPSVDNGPLNSTRSSLELTGIDCEPVKGLRAKFHPATSDRPARISTWTASLSGVFRHYEQLACDFALE